MKRPIGFEKLEEYAAAQKNKDYRIVILGTGANVLPFDGVWSFPEIDSYMVVPLFLIDWAGQKMHTRACISGAGTKGVWHDTYKPFYLSAVKSLDTFYSEILSQSRTFMVHANTPTYAEECGLRAEDLSITNIPLVVSHNRRYVVESSTPGKLYTATLTTDGYWECSCPGYMYSKASPKNCKHIDKVKKTLKW